jgi:hypothetical protein
MASLHVWLCLLTPYVHHLAGSQAFLQDTILSTFSTPWLSMVLMLAYTVFLLIIAFNMLVGIMMDTFARVRLKEDKEVLRSKVGGRGEGSRCPTSVSTVRKPQLAVGS